MNLKLFSKLLIVFVLSCYNAVSQTTFQIESNIGVSFQKGVNLDNYKLSNSSTFTWRFGGNVQFPLNKYYIETGIFGVANFGDKDTHDVSFCSSSLHVQVPLQFGYNINKKWQTSIGAVIFNERDFEDINFNQNHNLRYSLMHKINYKYTSNVFFSLQSNWALNDVPDVYAIAFPKNNILIGVIYSINQKSKKE